MPQPSILRLIHNAAALAAASLTLLFNDGKNAARLKRNESDWLRWEKRNVLIVRVLLAKAIHLALRCNMQRRVVVLWAFQAPIMLRVATAPKAFITPEPGLQHHA
jgi:hypothetical protein